jgi:hypothetical protein
MFYSQDENRRGSQIIQNGGLGESSNTLLQERNTQLMSPLYQ